MSPEQATHVPAPALEVTDLSVSYRVRGTDRPVLRELGLTIGPRESYGLVGESGCGKTTAAFAALRYLPRNGAVSGGMVRVAGIDPYTLSRSALRRFHRETVSMVYQDPRTALNPTLRIARQLGEVYRRHATADRLDSDHRVYDHSIAALQRVQIADPESVMKRYPHQLSGGMQQRVVLAMALAKSPQLLLLDEPTTGLDVTVEAEILELIAQLQHESGSAALFITHNLGVIAQTCQRVGVLYAGRLVEEGPTDKVLSEPQHPYTVGLTRCIPHGSAHKSRTRLDTIPGLLPVLGEELPGCNFADRCKIAQTVCRQEEPPLRTIGDGHRIRCHFPEQARALPRLPSTPTSASGTPSASEHPVLSVQGLTKVFREHGDNVHALRDVTLQIWPGETLGLVGESGSGKTTLAHAVAGLVEPTSGTIAVDGHGILAARVERRHKADARDLQLVFQNPDSALNRSHRVDRILRNAMRQLAGIRGDAAARRVAELADAVRLSQHHLKARPRQLSGGLKQRVAVAAAFAGEPRLVICDEPTSALDVSVQAAILNLLADLQTSNRVAYLFISHDLGVVRYISDRIGVLYLGRLMELASADTIFTGPHHPYTESLISALPTVDTTPRQRIKLRGEIPSAAKPPSGCVFHSRCHRKLGAICEQQEPPLLEAEPGHLLRCHIPLDQLGRTESSQPSAAAEARQRSTMPA